MQLSVFHSTTIYLLRRLEVGRYPKHMKQCANKTLVAQLIVFKAIIFTGRALAAHTAKSVFT